MKNIIKKFLTAFIIVMSCAFVCSPANAKCVFTAEAWLDGETVERIYGAIQDGKHVSLQYVGNDFPDEGPIYVLTSLPPSARIIRCDRVIEEGYEDTPEPVLFEGMGDKYILRFLIEHDATIYYLPFACYPAHTVVFNEWLSGSRKLPCELQILGDASIPKILVDVPFRQSFYAPSNIFVFVLDYFHTRG